MIARLSSILLSLTALLDCGCYNDRIERLEKQNQELMAEVKKDHAATDYDLQAKCARDSRVWFSENWQADKTTLVLTYTDHYNKKLNKCFIEVEYHYKLVGDSWANDLAVWDIYENTEYGTFSVTHMVHASNAGYSDQESIGSCKVYGRKCETLEEFNNLARMYMSD
jgi:hypothetical protein